MGSFPHFDPVARNPRSIGHQLELAKRRPALPEPSRRLAHRPRLAVGSFRNFLRGAASKAACFGLFTVGFGGRGNRTRWLLVGLAIGSRSGLFELLGRTGPRGAGPAGWGRSGLAVGLESLEFLDGLKHLAIDGGLITHDAVWRPIFERCRPLEHFLFMLNYAREAERLRGDFLGPKVFHVTYRLIMLYRRRSPRSRSPFCPSSIARC